MISFRQKQEVARKTYLHAIISDSNALQLDVGMVGAGGGLEFVIGYWPYLARHWLRL
jgi:hypothetical protein